jgi:hypothetical protein
MIGLDGDMGPVIKAWLTAILSLGEQTEAGEYAESVTL